MSPSWLVEASLRENCTVRRSQLTTGRKCAPGRGKSTCKGPKAGDPGVKGQEGLAQICICKDFLDLTMNVVRNLED